jgi:Amt family ammonium transporter
MSVSQDNCVIDTGDTAWVSICSILVLGMIPSLAMFESGMLRAKNSVSIFSQVIAGLAILSLMWFLFGYSVSFGKSRGSVIGFQPDYLAMYSVSVGECGPHSNNIPDAMFAFFNMMFAVITPLLMTGAFAERLKFKSFIVLIILWEIIVYYPICHWIWGGGWLQNLGALDFAGGIAIHVSAGAGSLVLALVMGRRAGFDKHHGEVTPHNMSQATLGVALLWLGWFGFNSGSSLTAGKTSLNAMICTQLSSSASAVAWMIMGWLQHKKPSLIMLLNGALSGLAGITPASGYVSIQSSVVIGLVLGLASYWSLYLLKHKLRIDDALDVSSVHGVTGAVGAFAIGICADKRLNDDGADGALRGRPILMAIQLLAIVVTFIWSGLWTCLLSIFVRKYITASEEQQEIGMDESEFMEKCYNFEDTGINHDEGEELEIDNNDEKNKYTIEEEGILNQIEEEVELSFTPDKV